MNQPLVFLNGQAGLFTCQNQKIVNAGAAVVVTTRFVKATWDADHSQYNLTTTSYAQTDSGLAQGSNHEIAIPYSVQITPPGVLNALPFALVIFDGGALAGHSHLYDAIIREDGEQVFDFNSDTVLDPTVVEGKALVEDINIVSYLWHLARYAASQGSSWPEHAEAPMGYTFGQIPEAWDANMATLAESIVSAETLTNMATCSVWNVEDIVDDDPEPEPEPGPGPEPEPDPEPAVDYTVELKPVTIIHQFPAPSNLDKVIKYAMVGVAVVSAIILLIAVCRH